MNQKQLSLLYKPHDFYDNASFIKPIQNIKRVDVRNLLTLIYILLNIAERVIPLASVRRLGKVSNAAKHASQLLFYNSSP